MTCISFPLPAAPGQIKVLRCACPTNSQLEGEVQCACQWCPLGIGHACLLHTNHARRTLLLTSNRPNLPPPHTHTHTHTVARASFRCGWILLRMHSGGPGEGRQRRVGSIAGSTAAPLSANPHSTAAGITTAAAALPASHSMALRIYEQRMKNLEPVCAAVLQAVAKGAAHEAVKHLEQLLRAHQVLVLVHTSMHKHLLGAVQSARLWVSTALKCVRCATAWLPSMEAYRSSKQKVSTPRPALAGFQLPPDGRRGRIGTGSRAPAGAAPRTVVGSSLAAAAALMAPAAPAAAVEAYKPQPLSS